MKKTIIDKALKHLNEDPKIRQIILNQNYPVFKKAQDPFIALSKSIIFQQLSGKSANAIYQRFINLYKSMPSAKNLLNIDDKEFQEAGLSRQKIIYLKALSTFFLSHENINFNILSDEEISNKLIEIKGIGQWTIDMFLMFTLFRTDILPIGDLGIQKGFKILYNLDELPTSKFMLDKSKPWSPYRTIASVYIWRLVDSEDDNW